MNRTANKNIKASQWVCLYCDGSYSPDKLYQVRGGCQLTFLDFFPLPLGPMIGSITGVRQRREGRVTCLDFWPFTWEKTLLRGPDMNIGILIAIATLSIYIIIGPLVLFAIYVFIDRLAQGNDNPQKEKKPKKADPALWGKQEVKAYIKHGQVPSPPELGKR
jgi:hypothetical protein